MAKSDTPRGFWQFYVALLVWSVTEVYSATDRVVTAVGVLIFFAALFSKEWAHKLQDKWDGASRWWAIAPIAVLLIWRLLRANYAHFSAEVKKSDEAKQELEIERSLHAAPELMLLWGLPKEARQVPGLGITYRVFAIENRSDIDAYDVQIEDVAIHPKNGTRATFKRVDVRRNSRVDVETKLVGNVPKNHEHEFEMVYYNLDLLPKSVLYTEENGMEFVRFPMSVVFRGYDSPQKYRAHFLFKNATLSGELSEITFMKREILT